MPLFWVLWNKIMLNWLSPLILYKQIMLIASAAHVHRPCILCIPDPLLSSAEMVCTWKNHLFLLQKATFQIVAAHKKKMSQMDIWRLWKYVGSLLKCSKLYSQSSKGTYGCILVCACCAHLASTSMIYNSAKGTCSFNNFTIWYLLNISEFISQ